MEAKRLGLCQKSLFVVPNHLTEQWAAEFLHLYPNAKLLVARRKDFETANRKKFCARIATGDYDAVIIGHSQFERVPLSFERQERIIQEQIDEIQDAISELKYASGERFTVKQMEKSRKNLEQKLEKLRAADRKDDVITFEQLGVDRLFVDESHAFKNLFLYTKMRNVAGLSTSEAQKSSDMFGKCRYLDEVTGGRGVIFATGTPVSNSMTELYTVMRYLQYGTLQKKNLTHFDCWAYASRVNGCTAHSISADNVEALILASVKRFSRFVLKDEETFALELQSLWKEKREEKPKQNQSELKRCQKRYDELSALIRSLYENLMSGLLPERQYKQLMAQYDSEQAELESQMETMKSEIAEDKSSSADIRHFISLIEKPREELTTTGSAPVPCAVTPTGLHTASRNFVPMSAGELTTTGKPWNSITRKKGIQNPTQKQPQRRNQRRIMQHDYHEKIHP